MKKEDLAEIGREVASCCKCPLCQGTTRAVPGEGNPETKVMFIGEGPGYWEDQKGRPFVGQAGKLLDELIVSIGLRREDVFITNVVKHRPSGNRDPLPSEIEACREYLDRQIKIIAPKIVVTLGRFSMEKFLPGQFISRLHGQPRFVDFAGLRIIVLPMYHPAAALRSEEVLRQAREDFLKIRQFLTLEEEKIDTEEKREDNKEQLSFLSVL